MTNSKIYGGIIVLLLVFMGSGFLYSHCQVPCGIYGDPTRFQLMAEHVTTIEKSMKLATDLATTERLKQVKAPTLVLHGLHSIETSGDLRPSQTPTTET